MTTLRPLMYITLILAVLSVAFLFWIYNPLQDDSQPKTLSSVRPPASVVHRCDPAYRATRRQTDTFVTVSNTKTLLMSAYLEHRSDKKEVRVMTVMLQNQAGGYYCTLCCQGKELMSEGVSQIPNIHYGFPYGLAYIMCPIPLGCETPSHIAVTTVASLAEDELEFLEVQNQEAKSDQFPYNFTVCISTMYNFTNVLQLVQTFEMFLLLGVDRVVVYKTSCSPETQLILDYYTQKGFLEVIPWTLSKYIEVSHYIASKMGPGEIHYFGQVPALNDCLYRSMYRSKYVAMQDIDELILPQSANSWLELFPQLEKDHSPDMCYKFETITFPNNVKIPPPDGTTIPQQNCWKNIPGVNILAHLYHKGESVFQRSNCKIVTSPRPVFSLAVHRVENSHKDCTWVDKNIAHLYHTRVDGDSETLVDQLTYDGRLLKFSTPLMSAVNKVLEESGVLPKDSKC